MKTMKITLSASLLLIQTLQCLASDDSPFQLTNKATGFCLVKTNNLCNEMRWTTGDRLLVHQRRKCLGVQGKSVGSEIGLYDCNENSELQKWECQNETVLALKDQELYIELTADNTAVLSRTVGPKSHLTISGTSSGACTRTYRELYTIDGNAAGMPCMFPFQYQGQWYSDCTQADWHFLWCAVETNFQNERWGHCPVTSKEHWNVHPTTGAYYQLNTQSALTWAQAETSCRQQGASLLSITDPHQQAYVTALLGTESPKLWIGLLLNPEHGWTWSNRRPYCYMKWDTGNPLHTPGHNCAIVEPTVRYSWQSYPCSKKLGYICYSQAPETQPTQAVETGFCSSPWIPYNGHCFYVNRTQKTWSDAQRECRSTGGDLVSVRNVEDQSFVISQLGYTSTDELWIGLNDRKTEGLFEWADHSTVSFTSWEFGKPAVSTDVKDCVLIRGPNGNWADRACEEKHGFICMKPSATTAVGDEVQLDEGCKTGWRRRGYYCYFIGTQTKTFNEAVNDCKSSNSYLADVSDGVDNAFLISLVGMRPEKYFWIGLSNQNTGGRFAWTNTNSVRFTHWNAYMPGHRQGCVAIKTGVLAGLWDVLPCTNKEKYICKHRAEGVLPTPTPTILTTPPTCPPEWIKMKTKDICFKMFSDGLKRTWFQARDYCTTIGGDLLSIHSITDTLRIPPSYTSAWIGLRAPGPGASYVWSDGSPLQFQHWSQGEPTNRNNVEFCVEFRRNHRTLRGSWSVGHCEKDLGWLCQIPTGVTPKPAPDPIPRDHNSTRDGWLEWNGNQYFISRSRVAMEDARLFCKRRQSDLVTINSEAESVFLWKQTIYSNARYFWIGLNVDLDKTYGWMDGSPVVYQRWDEGQPRFVNNDENCAVTSPRGFWRDSNCGLSYESICKRNSTPPAPAPAPMPTSAPLRGGCPQGWTKLNSKCYIIMHKKKETWDGAKTQCKAMGGNLASILSRHEQLFLTTKMIEAPGTDLWIGMHSKNSLEFYWTDGRPNRFSSWNIRNNFHHHFSPERRDCAAMTSDAKNDLGNWVKKSCNDTNGYVCLRSVDPSLPDSPEPTTTDYVKILNDSVKVVTTPMTWYAANKNCKENGATLASLRNAWSKAYIDLVTYNLNAPVWIGLNTKETAGYFVYIDGWHLPFANWANGEPRSDQPCVYVDEQGKWKTSDCSGKQSSICMKSTDVPPTESTAYPGMCPESPKRQLDVYSSVRSRRTDSWLPFKGNCYLVLLNEATWPEASANCAAHGGSLVSIEDPSEQAFIHGIIEEYEDSQDSFWIGLYKTNRGQWLWLDKTTVDYTNWDEYHPYDRRYALMKVSGGKWQASHPFRKGYICKAPKVVPLATTTAAKDMEKPQTHNSHILPVVVVICVAVLLAIIIVVFFLKRSGRSYPVFQMSSAFHNPLFSTSQQ
ncbi:macrophage mannose receptor 1-like [Xyrichtys novacula]|uniref:Macrophage mannose receptor 1-like n=1 Tax=Xyrichtys novacula TaxID=13765 RepID=A0AAV1GI58_XYRNO|nr:macrophage mannose receptor 1-like [Xyrichtys novacula]